MVFVGCAHARYLGREVERESDWKMERWIGYRLWVLSVCVQCQWRSESLRSVGMTLKFKLFAEDQIAFLGMVVEYACISVCSSILLERYRLYRIVGRV